MPTDRRKKSPRRNAESKLYIGGYNKANAGTEDRHVWCLDAATGKLAWKSDAVTSALNVVSVGERVMFSNALRGKGNVFDSATGKVVYSIQTNYACCRFTMSEPYVLGANMDMIDLSQGGKLVSTGPAIDSRECLYAVFSKGRIFYTSRASGFIVSQTYGPESKNLPLAWEVRSKPTHYKNPELNSRSPDLQFVNFLHPAPTSPMDRIRAMAEEMEASFKRGRTHSIVLVAERVKMDKQSWESAAWVVSAKLAEAFRHGPYKDIETRASVPGHLQRGGRPAPFDSILAAEFAEVAWNAIAAGKDSGITVLQNGAYKLAPFGSAPVSDRAARLWRLHLQHLALSRW